MHRESEAWLTGAKVVAILPLTNEERVKRPHRKVYLMVTKGRQSRDVYLCVTESEVWLEIES